MQKSIKLKTKTIEKINYKSLFFSSKVNNIDKPLVRLTKKKEKTELSGAGMKLAILLQIQKISKE